MSEIIACLGTEPMGGKGGIKAKWKGTSIGERCREQVKVSLAPVYAASQDTRLALPCSTVSPILLNCSLNYSSA